jgi:hypothetical protein
MPYSAYHVAYQIKSDNDLHVRVSAAAQQEAEAAGGLQGGFDPESWALARSWGYGTQTDWIAAVSTALENGVPKWGADPGVITDQHILSYVQAQFAG